MQERRAFDDRFVRRDSSALCDLTSAADALEMRALVDLGTPWICFDLFAPPPTPLPA